MSHRAAQRIEVDEMAVQQAASRARKGGMVFALIALALGVGVGVVAGIAKDQSDGRAQAKSDAKDLDDKVKAARDKIDQIGKKVQEGADKLSGKNGKKEFPKGLADELGGINPSFDGTLLAGRRFSGFSTDTSKNLFDFVTNVNNLNDHKTAIKNLLTKLEKPITEQLDAAAAGKHNIQYVVLLGGISAKDPGGNYVANLAQLAPAISFTGDNPNIPNDMTANFAGRNVSVSKYKGGNMAEASAMYVTPVSFDAVCPPQTSSLVAQLAVKMGDLINEINGEPKQTDVIVDSKPGLLEQADTLAKGLEATIAK